MRELVYLSETKLLTFIVDKPGRWRNASQVEGEVKAFGLGAKLNLTPGSRRGLTPDLDRVVSALEGSDRAPKWFADDNVQPGDWVHYEAPLGYVSIGDMVVFLDSDQPTPAYPTDCRLRLLLHGSLGHLVGVRPGRLVDKDHESVRFHRSSFFLALECFRASLEAGKEDGSYDVYDWVTARLWPKQISDEFNVVIAALDARLHSRYTAAWMAGYARVTALLPHRPWSRDGRQRPKEPIGKIVVASPLYVEYVSQPSLD
jgi:hypothetical protein